MKKLLIAALVLAPSLGLGPGELLPPANAQEAGIVCVTGVTRGAAGGQPVTFAVPSTSAHVMLAKGYSLQPCSGEEQGLVQLHEDACRLASRAPAQAQARFEEVYGISPSELCSLTNIVGE